MGGIHRRIIAVNDIREEKPIDEATDEISEITTEEMERPINSLAKRKSPGEDEIPAELFQALGSSGKEQLRILIKDIYISGTLPKDFTVGEYVHIPKVNKATKSTPLHNQPNLTRLKNTLKIIMERINPIIYRHLDETQLGFRKKKGSRDGIFLLRNISERMVAHQKDLYMCFIDYTQAFDSMNHAKLIEVLTKGGVSNSKSCFEGTRNIDTKKRILQYYVFSVFISGCETWTFTKAVKDRIKSFEIWCLGRVLRISWKNHETNEGVLQSADVTKRLLDQLIKKKLRCAGHVIRESSGHLL
ncbi:RNA-directed DNA polymerase from mobile element jockey-like [Elysia marginata]|uniref:RNA-directed DNA polymerase from mobile element jockey-like n=1 Tax=Elysia marginata TaxID=1093978 RepID=A0AAV4IY76_9GAST|nr:RNA-directed DNA polymerase from mobile element jockey-like [Elysia marginata]